MAKRTSKSSGHKMRRAPGPDSQGPRAPGLDPGGTKEKWLLLKAMLILLAGAVTLSPTLLGTWHGDDPLYLTSNPLLFDPHRIWKAWFDPGSFIEYYPIEQTVQWYQWKLWGTRISFGYLMTNLGLHLLSALLLWRLFRKVGLKLAWLGGLIFVLHPMMVDSVGVSCELKNTLSLPPFLLAMGFYLDFEAAGKTRHYVLAWCWFLIAMLCKITMFFFPLVILLYAWWKRGKITRSDCWAAAPFLLVSLVLCYVTLQAGVIYAVATPNNSPSPIYLGGFISRMALAGMSLIFYFGRCFFPLHPMPLYPLWKIDPPSLLDFLPWVGIAVAFGTCWMKRASWGRPALFGMGFFTLALGPFLGFNKVSYMCLAWVHDHFVYIPIIGLIGLVIAGLERIATLLPRRFLPVGVGCIGLAIGLLGGQTFSYARIFADSETQWRYNLIYNPDMWYIRFGLGTVLASRGQLPEGISELRESVRLNPTFPRAWLNLGIFLCNSGQFAESITCYHEVLQRDPSYTIAHLNLAEALLMAGQVPESIKEFSGFLALEPGSAEGHSNLSTALSQEGEISEATKEIETALQLEPDNKEFQSWLETLKQMPAQATGQKRPDPLQMTPIGPAP